MPFASRVQLEAFGFERGLALLPRREHDACLERLVLAYVGLLTRRERLAGDDRSAPDRGRSRPVAAIQVARWGPDDARADHQRGS